MGFIKRSPPLVKIEDADTPIEQEVCIIETSNDGNTIDILCVPESIVVIEDKPAEEVKAEAKPKPKAVITSSATGEQFGNWIPSLHSAGTIDISIRNAFYTKIGQLVTCTFDIVVTNMYGGKKDSPVILGGLPVSSIGIPNSMSGSAYISYFKVSNYDIRQISGTIQGNDIRVDLWCEKRGPGGLVPLTQIDINVNTVLAGTVTYITNS